MSLLKRIERDVKQTASDGGGDEAIWRRCFNKLSARWLSREGDTGDLPRTWKSVLTALKKSGFDQLASEMEKMLSGEHTSGRDKGVQGDDSEHEVKNLKVYMYSVVFLHLFITHKMHVIDRREFKSTIYMYTYIHTYSQLINQSNCIICPILYRRSKRNMRMNYQCLELLI